MKTPANLRSPLAVARRLLSGVPQASLDDASFLPWLIVEGASAFAKLHPPLTVYDSSVTDDTREDLTRELNEKLKSDNWAFVTAFVDADGSPTKPTKRAIYRAADCPPWSRWAGVADYQRGPLPSGVTTATERDFLANPTLAPKPSEEPPVFSPPSPPSPPSAGLPAENKSVVQPPACAPTENVLAVASETAPTETPPSTWKAEKADHGASHWASRDRVDPVSVPDFMRRALPGVAAAEKLAEALTEMLGSEANPTLAQNLPEVAPEGGPAFFPEATSVDNLSEENFAEDDVMMSDPSAAAPPASSLASSSIAAATQATPTLTPPLPSRAPPSPPAPLAVQVGLLKDWPKREENEDDITYGNRLTYVIQMVNHPVTIQTPEGPKEQTLTQPMVTSAASQLAKVVANRLKLTSPWFAAMAPQPQVYIGPNTLLPTVVVDGEATFRPLAEAHQLREDNAMAKFGFARYGFVFANFQPTKNNRYAMEAYVQLREADAQLNMELGMHRLADFEYTNMRVLKPTVFGHGMIVVDVNQQWLKATTIAMASIGIRIQLADNVDEPADEDDSEY